MHSILRNLCSNSKKLSKKTFLPEGFAGPFMEKFSKEIVGLFKCNCVLGLKMAANALCGKDGQSGQRNYKSVRTCSRWDKHHIKSDTGILSRDEGVNSSPTCLSVVIQKRQETSGNHQ